MLLDAGQYGIVASCNPTQVGSQTSGLYHRMELYPLWQVQSSHQQQLKIGDICEVHH